jgi:uncharacterized membrane protein
VFVFPAYDALKTLGYEDFIALLPLAEAFVLVLMFFRSRMTYVAGVALAFITAALPMQFEHEWLAMALALEAAALAWLYTRIPHSGLLFWSAGLSLFVLYGLIFESELRDHRDVYLVTAIAMFAAAYLVQPLRPYYAASGTIELFARLNIEIGRYYEGAASSLAQDLTYTIAWAVFAIAMLVAGIALRARYARIAALGLLLVTILKCFLHDLARLGGLYRVASLFGLAVSLMLVGLLLQKFVIMKADAETARVPSGTT